LTPLGVTLLHTADDIAVPLPLADDSLDLVINRHANHAAEELLRILRLGGRFLTQQVGGQDQFRLNEIFQDDPHFEYSDWTLAYAVNELEAAGFTILDAREAFPETRFLDIGALVYYLKIIEWQVPDFDIHKDRAILKQVHAEILQRGFLETHQHRFLIEALKTV
jgi:SAM-dependent methyltransferase